MKYYIIAGEASGDLHGANLMKALLEKDPKAEFRFWVHWSSITAIWLLWASGK